MNPKPVHHHLLRRAARAPGWQSLAYRLAAVIGLILFAIMVHWLDRDGLRYTARPDEPVSLVDIIYFTAISISTTGYGDIVPVTPGARLFDALVVTPIRVFVVLIFLGTAYTFLIRHTWERWQMRRIQQKLSGHTIVCGYGISNRQAVAELILRGESPTSIVVVDDSLSALEEAEEIGCNVMQGDATRDQVLADARIDSARTVLVSAGRDDTSVLIVLTARALAPDVPISVVIRATDNESLAAQAGATTVINPVSFTGLLLAGSTHGEHVASYLADLASVDGSVSLRERLATEQDVGKRLSDVGPGIGVRLYRGERGLAVIDDDAALVEPGDMIVEIVRGNGVVRPAI